LHIMVMSRLTYSISTLIAHGEFTDIFLSLLQRRNISGNS